MRVALAMGKTLRQLEKSLGSDEWTLWLAFLSEYDLPDGFFTAGRVCTAFVESKLSDHVPFYVAPKRAMTPAEISAKFRSAREKVRNAERDR